MKAAAAAVTTTITTVFTKERIAVGSIFQGGKLL